MPLFGHLREIGVNELCDFYEILHFRATTMVRTPSTPSMSSEEC